MSRGRGDGNACDDRHAEIAGVVLSSLEAGQSEDALFEALRALGVRDDDVAEVVDVVNAALSRAVLLAAGLPADQIASDLDADPLFVAALESARRMVAAEASDVTRGLTELSGALASEDPLERQDAVYELGQSGDSEAIAPLVAALEDRDRDVRIYAVQALAEIGDRRAAGPLADHLPTETDHTVLANTLLALGRIGDPAVLPSIIGATMHEDPLIRYDAVSALDELGDPAAIPALEELSADRERPVVKDGQGRIVHETDVRICDHARRVIVRLGKVR